MSMCLTISVFCCVREYFPHNNFTCETPHHYHTLRYERDFSFGRLKKKNKMVVKIGSYHMINEVAKKTNKQTWWVYAQRLLLKRFLFCKWPIELDPKALCLCLMLAVKTPYCRWISLTTQIERIYVIYTEFGVKWGTQKRAYSVECVLQQHPLFMSDGPQLVCFCWIYPTNRWNDNEKETNGILFLTVRFTSNRWSNSPHILEWLPPLHSMYM